jgi:hypothetical protein
MRSNLSVFLVILAFGTNALAADPARMTIWQGTLHLGDNAAQFASAQSAGMAIQVPFTLDPEKKGKLIITTRDIQTLAGEGHYAELLAHYQDDDGPAREYTVETFRLKGDSNNADIDHPFDFDPMKKLYAKPAYYSLRVKVDSQIKFSLWDDFLLKRIDIEQ